MNTETMNTKPFDTPASDFTDEELEAMTPDELLVRSAHRIGSIEALSAELSLMAASEVVAMIKDSRDLTEMGLMPVDLIAEMLGEGIMMAMLATIQSGRDIQRFVTENPDFPEEAPDVPADESV